MKNSFKVGFLALAIAFSFAACRSNKTAAAADSTRIADSLKADSGKADSAKIVTGADTTKKDTTKK